MNRELVEAARRGDRDAFDALVRLEVRGVYRTAVAILGSAADAEEATQDAFVSAWRNLGSLRDPARFDAWLGRIVVNACRMALRHRRTVREITVDESLDFARSDRFEVDPAVLAATADSFDRAFDRLTIEDRALLVFAYRDDVPLAEISERIGVPVGTVKSRLSRARRSLQAALDGEDAR